MNIFKRELTLFLRSRIFLIVLPLYTVIQGLWHLLLKDIYNLYSLIPAILCFIIPILTYGLWFRERALGLEGFFLISKIDINRILYEKLIYSLTASSIFIIVPIPLLTLHLFIGDIDLGRVFSIYIGLILYISIAVSIGLLLSALLKGRILIYISTIVILGVITINRGYGAGEFTRFFGLISLNRLIEDFFKGIINLRAIFIASSIFLTAIFFTKLYIKRRVSKKIITIISLLVTVSFFIGGKTDSTVKRSYSLTEDAKEILSASEVPVLITYYYSKELESRSPVIKDIKYILSKFDNNENCRVRYVSDREDIFYKGVKSFNPHPLEDKDKYYSFMVVECLSEYKVLPLVSIAETLEFDILRSVMNLIRDERKHIAIMPGDEGLTVDSFSMLNSLLSQYFDVSFIFPGDEIPKDLSSLIVAGHYLIDYDTIKAIGDYLSGGGNILIAGTGLPTTEGLNYRSTPMLESLQNIGVTIEAFLIGDNNNVGIVDESGRVKPYPLNVVTEPYIKGGGNLITSPFPGFNALYLSPVLSENSAFKPLLTSSKESWLVTKESGLDGSPEGAYPVALWGEGRFASHFLGKESNKTNRVLIVGNTLSFTDLAYSLRVDADYEFIFRSIYKLNGDDSLLRSRSKLIRGNPIKELKYPKEGKIKLINIFFIIIYPIVILLISIFIRRKSF